MVHSEEDAVREFNVKLLEILPLDDTKFFGMVNAAKLFPLNTGNEIEAKPTRAQKVAYFIQHVLSSGAKEYLPMLLRVMKHSEVSNLVKLADDIQGYMTSGLSIIFLIL